MLTLDYDTDAEHWSCLHLRAGAILVNTMMREHA